MKTFALVSLFVVACASSAPGPDSPHATACFHTIDEYCAARHCPTYDEAASGARKNMEPGALYRFSIGTCGTYRFVQTQVGTGMSDEFFDASGKLVSSSSVADAPMCGSEFANTVGTAPQCERVVVESGDASKSD
jgi:hypothetical protein